VSDPNARARELVTKLHNGQAAVDSATLALLLQYGAEVREACTKPALELAPTGGALPWRYGRSDLPAAIRAVPLP
jgi:hypothetical protein